MSWTKGLAYAQDLRDRVLAAPGLLGEVAARFGVSQAYVCTVRARRSRPGLSSAGAQRNHMPPRLAGVKQELPAEVARAPEQTRPDVPRARAAWTGGQPRLPAGQLIFPDQTWATTCMTPTRGPLAQRPALPGIRAGGPLAHHHVCLRAQRPRAAGALGA